MKFVSGLRLLVCHFIVTAITIIPTQHSFGAEPNPITGTFRCEILPNSLPPLKKPERYVDLRGGAVCRGRINASLPAFQFKVASTPESYIASNLEVTLIDQPATLQILKPEVMEPYYAGQDFLFLEDINFDGYLDLKLLCWSGATGNTGYQYWIYSPQTGKFVEEPKLREISNPVPDPATKTIEARSVYGHAGKLFNREIYAFDKDSELVCLRTVAQDWDAEKKSYVRTFSERRDGKLVVVGTEIVDGDKAPPW